jgi:hypothetical protein
MKVYLPRWARTAAATTIFGAAMSKQMKLNKPQQMQVGSIMRKLTADAKWVDLGKQDRKFLKVRMMPFVDGLVVDARSHFSPFWKIFLRPRRFMRYQLRSRGMKLLLSVLTIGAK